MARFHPALIALLASTLPVVAAAPAQAQLFVNVSVGIAPPPLPVYDQPRLPGPDYIWLPGYWAWDDDVGDYFWVPGTWALAPRPGFVWTPPWWGWSDGAYVFHSGYWAPHVGWYGGIPYGFGYTGFGFEGGHWEGPHFFYNRSVTNVTNVNVTNIYNKTVVVNRTVINNVSFNGGPGGIQARPTPALLAATREPHLAPTPEQQAHIATARKVPQLFAAANRGAPPVAATLAPARLVGPGIVKARAPGGFIPPRPAGSSGYDRPVATVRPQGDAPRLAPALVGAGRPNIDRGTARVVGGVQAGNPARADASASSVGIEGLRPALPPSRGLEKDPGAAPYARPSNRGPFPSTNGGMRIVYDQRAVDVSPANQRPSLPVVARGANTAPSGVPHDGGRRSEANGRPQARPDGWPKSAGQPPRPTPAFRAPAGPPNRGQPPRPEPRPQPHQQTPRAAPHGPTGEKSSPHDREKH